jgi:hypothetical protein
VGHGDHVHPEELHHPCLVEVDERTELREPGAVDEHVDPVVVSLAEVLHHGARRAGRTEILHDHGRLDPVTLLHILGETLHRLSGAGHEHDVVALGRQQAHELRPEPGGRPGDESGRALAHVSNDSDLGPAA